MSGSSIPPENQPKYEPMGPDGQPGWLKYFENNLELSPVAKTFPFSTLDSEHGQPRVRYVIHRFTTPASSFLGLTTDVRMQKFSQLSSSPSFEAAFWMPDPNVQFRISGKARVLPNDPNQKDELEKCLKELGAHGDESSAQYWIDKREEMWKTQSGHLRASFARPTPGTPLSEIDGKPEDWSETIKPEGEDDASKKEIEEAKTHFALVVLSPAQVEMLELKVIPNRRHIWTKKSSSPDKDEWDIVAVVP